jgi:hypothetical protein
MQTSEAIQIAKLYFELSNKSNITEIAKLMTENTTYSSVHQGVFLGNNQIIKMQTAFHGSFDFLKWKILEIDEIRPGVVYINFTMNAQRVSGDLLEIHDDEYVVVKDGKLQHIEVRNKQ